MITCSIRLEGKITESCGIILISEGDKRSGLFAITRPEDKLYKAQRYEEPMIRDQQHMR